MLKRENKNSRAVLKHLKICPEEDRESYSSTSVEHILDSQQILWK